MMNQITKAEEMVGRTIEWAYVAPWQVVLNLGNGDYVCIEPAGDREGGSMLEFDEKPALHCLRDIGVLSVPEYESAEAERQRVMTDAIKTRELSQLAKLRKKYPEWSK